MKYDYDLVVIGSGIGGLAGTLMAAGLGKRVALVEKDRFGGKCTWHNCMPLKALIRASHAMKEAANLGQFGLEYAAGSPTINTDAVLPKIKAIIESLSLTDTAAWLEAAGVKVIHGAPEFIDSHALSISGERVSAGHFLIATGSVPSKPHVEGIDLVEFLNCETIYDLTRLPRSIIILGGGADGVEFAQAFNNLGVAVTLVELAPAILSREDSELAAILTGRMEQSGIRVFTGHKATQAARDAAGINLGIADSQGRVTMLQSETLLTTVGRDAGVLGLKLEAAEVEYSLKGIAVDNQQRTTASNIYAAGDVCGPIQLAAMAEYQALNAVNNMFFPVKRLFDPNHHLSVIFSDPPLARTGLTEAEALEQFGESVRVYRMEYAAIRRARIDGNVEGLAKIITSGDGRVIGANILGAHADEIIHQYHALRLSKAPLSGLHAVTHAYPTYSEALVKRIADMDYLDELMSNSFVRLGLELLPGFRNNLKAVKKII